MKQKEILIGMIAVFLLGLAVLIVIDRTYNAWRELTGIDSQNQ